MATVTDVLKNPATRWKFVVLSALLIIVLFGTRFVFFPLQLTATSSYWDNVCVKILEALGTAVLTAICVQALALWFGKDEKAISLIQILDRATETDPAFEKAFKSTKGLWYFKGGFGGYFRSDTLPALVASGQTALDVMVVLIDTQDNSLVENYADYRKQATGDDNVTAKKVKEEIEATILALAKAVKDKSGAFSHARIAFIGSYSPFRIDFHDSGVILTHDSKTSPALMFSAESKFYRGFRQEMEQFKSKAIDLKSLPKGDLDNLGKILAHRKK